MRFFTAVWNLTYLNETAGVHYLRATGAFRHVLAIRYAAAPCMHRMVFDAADRAAVDALYSQVVAHGLKTAEAPGPLRQPHGAYGFGFKDPEGRNTAIVCGVADHKDIADAPDRPRKLSHVNINAGDSEATFLCYRDALGFRSPTPRGGCAFSPAIPTITAWCSALLAGRRSTTLPSRCPTSSR